MDKKEIRFLILIFACFGSSDSTFQDHIKCVFERFFDPYYNLEIWNYSSVDQLELDLNQITDTYLNCNGYEKRFTDSSNVSIFNSSVEKLPSKLFEKLTNIRFLNADNVGLKKIDGNNFKFATELSNLNLANIIVEDHKMLLESENFKKLNILSLSNTSLTSLNISSFANFEALTELHLDHNKISHIEYGVFGQLWKLKSLTMSHNNLHHLNIKVLSSMQALVELDISYNQLTHIKMFDRLKQFLRNLGNLQLEGNRWNCEYLADLFAASNVQQTTLGNPKNSVKNKPNLNGIECFQESYEEAFWYETEEVNESSEEENELNDCVDKEKIVQLSNKITNLKVEIANMKRKGISSISTIAVILTFAGITFTIAVLISLFKKQKKFAEVEIC